MREELLKGGLRRAVGKIELPITIWQKIETELQVTHRKLTYFKKLLVCASTIILFVILSIISITPVIASIQKSWTITSPFGTFTLNLVQNVGDKVAEVSPTLYLPTTLAHAKQVARMQIKIPSYLPDGIKINSDTPTLVGRFGSSETVAIKISEELQLGNGGTLDSILLDIRQSNVKNITTNLTDDDRTVEKVKVGNYEGLLILDNKGRPVTLNWTDGTSWFRLFGRFDIDKTELIKIARSMK